VGAAARRARLRAYGQHRGGARRRGTTGVVDTRSRTARDGRQQLAHSGEAIASHAVGGLGDTLLVVGPEHARTLGANGWSKAQVRAFLWDRLRAEVATVST